MQLIAHIEKQNEKRIILLIILVYIKGNVKECIYYMNMKKNKEPKLQLQQQQQPYNTTAVQFFFVKNSSSSFLQMKLNAD